MLPLVLQGLSKRYGAVQAVQEVSCTVQPGRVTAFLGPNGAGKTTTMRMLLGLVKPSSGTALIGTQPYRDVSAPRRVVGAVLGSDVFHPGRSGRDHLRVVSAASDLPRVRVDEVLHLVELTGDADRRVAGYSLGMRQRLALATALLGDPQVLIADEPTNGLDPAGVAWLRTFLRGLAGQGRTVLLSSHLLSEVARTADHVLVISGGRLRFDGPLEELAQLAGSEDVEALEAAFLELTARTA